MYFLYKTKDGVIDECYKDYDIPKGLSKLIVKDYDGSRLRLPYVKETIIDANLESITEIELDCDILKIYNLGTRLSITASSKIKEIAHIDMRKVTNMVDALMYVSVTKICELDYRNVVFSYKLFYGSKLTDIPPMKNYEHLNSGIFEGTKIPIHKERTWSKLMRINKK